MIALHCNGGFNLQVLLCTLRWAFFTYRHSLLQEVL